MTFLPREKRFAAVANRFDWVDAINSDAAEDKHYARRRAALRFERVLSAQVHGIDLKNKSAVVSLLAIALRARRAARGQRHPAVRRRRRHQAACGVHRGGAARPGAGVGGQVQAARIPDEPSGPQGS